MSKKNLNGPRSIENSLSNPKWKKFEKRFWNIKQVVTIYQMFYWL